MKSLNYISLFFVLLLASCSVNRKSVTSKQSFLSDSIHHARKDSLYLNRLLESSIRKTLRLEHITLSKPDTLGRQYVETVSILASNTAARQNEHLKKETVSLQTDERKQSISSYEQKKMLRGKNPFLIVLCGVMSFFLFFKFYIRRK